MTASSTSRSCRASAAGPGIGLAAGSRPTPTDGLGAVGAYAALSDYTALGGMLTVFAIPG